MGSDKVTLPDFDEMLELVNTLADIKSRVYKVKVELAEVRARAMRDAIYNKDNWPPGGKPPSMKYCETVIAYVGNNETEEKEIARLSRELAELIAQEEFIEELLRVKRTQADVYRTESANLRLSLS